MKQKSYIKRAKAHFATIAGKKPVFTQPAIMHKLHPDWEIETGCIFGSSMEEAKLIVDLLPPKHVEYSQFRYRDYDSVILADMWRVSEQALLSIAAWKFSGGDDFGGTVRLLEVAPIEKDSDSPEATLFSSLIGDMEPTFILNRCALLRPRDEAFKAPVRWSVGHDEKAAWFIIYVIPENHIKRMCLEVSETGAILADITFLSTQAYAALEAWEECGWTMDEDVVREEMEFHLPEKE